MWYFLNDRGERIRHRSLEQRQNTNDSIQSKIIPISNLSRFFPRRIVGEKERQFQSWNYFWTE